MSQARWHFKSELGKFFTNFPFLVDLWGEMRTAVESKFIHPSREGMAKLLLCVCELLPWRVYHPLQPFVRNNRKAFQKPCSPRPTSEPSPKKISINPKQRFFLCCFCLPPSLSTTPPVNLPSEQGAPLLRSVAITILCVNSLLPHFHHYTHKRRNASEESKREKKGKFSPSHPTTSRATITKREKLMLRKFPRERTFCFLLSLEKKKNSLS